MKLILLIVAIVLFLIAAITASGAGVLLGLTWAAWLCWGLVAFAASFLPIP